MHFAEVILPLSLPKTFTYQVSEAEFTFLKPGMRVTVPFGTNKIYTAMVCRLHQDPPQLYQAREIEQILDEKPIVGHHQLEHWQWVAQYYMCPIGDVYRSALPSALLLESETVIALNETFSDRTTLTDDEFLVCEALEHQPVLQMADIVHILNKKSVFPVIRSMIDKGAVLVREELSDSYKPKMVRYIRLHPQWEHEDALRDLLEKLKSAEKQRLLVMLYFQLSAGGEMVTVKSLLDAAGVTSAVLKSLLDKQVFEDFFLREGRVRFPENTASAPELSDAQQQALTQTSQQLAEKDVCLLFGVTSSGKTEIYIKLIHEYLKTGKQVLYLLPEIALTTQLVTRLVKYFGDKVTVYHSKYSNNERVEAWQQVLSNSENARIVIGARSALFLPFADLGLVIVDEEHEPTFKQHDPAPRYHARDAAIVLAKLWNARVLLGSATPSLETFHNARQGKYGLVELTRRFGEVRMPEIVLVDLKEKYYRKEMNGHFSDTLVEAIRGTLDTGGQVILFQNRRGFSNFLECTTCGHVPQCSHCDVSLTYHLSRNQLRCHYCGYAIAKPQRCHACAGTELTTKGLGTEQVQEELVTLFPKAKIGRMDQDTTRGKYSFERIIESFRSGETDILVGTQMLAKGLDFENVKLVGIMNADNMLNQPDFRAHERSFQLMAQVAGRSGRAGAQGKVLIQSYHPQHPVLQHVIENNYYGLFREQIHEREQYKYPPFYKIIRLTLRQRDFEKVREGAIWLHSVLQQQLRMPVLGPEEPPVSRIRNEYLRSIMIKVKVGTPLEGTKKTVQKIMDSFHAVPQFRSVKITVNVDPY